MRRFQLLFATVSLICMAALLSCSKPPVEPENTSPKVELGQCEVMVGYEGGLVGVSYSVTNPIGSIDIATKTNVEWITELVSDGQRLTFRVEPNDVAEERSAHIAIKYPNVEDVRLVVRQGAMEGLSFKFEVSNKTTTTCTTKVIPSDPEALYIVYMSELDYFYQAGITTAEELFLDDYNYFMDFVQEYGVEQLKEFLLMNEVAFVGERDITWTQMTPDKEYVLYAYAIEINEANNDYSLASPIAHTMFSLSSTDLSVVKFDVEVAIDGPEATYNITPVDWDGKYYLEIFEEGEYMYRAEGTVLDEAYARIVSNTWMSMISLYMQSGYGAEQLMELMCLEGVESYSEVRKSSTNYAMILYAIEMVDGLPQVASMPQLVNFRTEEVQMSDMVLDIKIENNYVRVADITVTPSTDDPYTVALVATDEVPESSDAEIMQWLIDNFSMSTYRGSIFSHINSLEPESDYTVLAFGYYGNTITTDLYRVDFSTEAEGECQNSIIDVRWNGPYSLMDLELAEPDKYYNYGMFESMGWYAMWSEIETAEPTPDMFYCIYRADRFAIEGEQVIFDDLVQYVNPQVQLLTGESDVLYVMCAVIMDYKGNYSPMWVSEPFRYTYSADTKLPVEELLEKLGQSN